MTLQNLSKILDKYDSQLGSGSIQQFELLKGLSFYDWNSDKNNLQTDHNVFTFNHAIGLPQKDGQAMPLFDYEQMLYDTLQTNKHVWIKKATGLGVTEFMLRYMAWLCFQDTLSQSQAKSQMCIVTGPRIELAITLIDRMKDLFRNRFQVQFDTKETVIELNGVHIEAYPSNHLRNERVKGRIIHISG
jgi:hypothetical protein